MERLRRFEARNALVDDDRRVFEMLRATFFCLFLVDEATGSQPTG
jgi:hypothetical protein